MGTYGRGSHENAPESGVASPSQSTSKRAQMFNRISLLVAAAGLATNSLWAATSPFVGDWKLDSSKSTLSDQMKVESLGGKKYAFDFGGGAEVIDVDGTDQPGANRTTLSVSVAGPEAWRVTRHQNGHTLLVANWTLSRDGNSLIDDFTSFGQDGAPSNIKYVYERTRPGTGFAGTWVSTNMKVNFAFVLEIKPYEEDGISIINAVSRLTRNMKLDGKYYPNEGASAAMVPASSVRKVDEHTLELKDRKSDGKLYADQRLTLSPDLKTLTMTPYPGARDQPRILVFERQ